MKSALVSSVACFAALAGCGGDDAPEGPLVGSIDEAVAAIEEHYGGPQEYFEISATPDAVSVVVAVDDATAAEQGVYEPGGGLTVPEPVGPASGATFTADAIDVDPDKIFDRLREELDDPAIVDFAVQGTDAGTAIYDATVASEAGGVLLVLLGPDGEILGVQGR